MFHQLTNAQLFIALAVLVVVAVVVGDYLRRLPQSLRVGVRPRCPGAWLTAKSRDKSGRS